LFKTRLSLLGNNYLQAKRAVATGVGAFNIWSYPMTISHRLGLASALTTALFISACSTPMPTATAPAAPAQAPVVAAPAAPAKPAMTAPVAAAPIAPYLDPQNSLSQKRSVYFDFDQFTVKNEYMAVLENHGKFLSSNPKVSVRIEGNADEQGSSEYNLALGQKRAEAVAKALKIMGVKDAQMEAVSLGEEKPKATGHDEASHAQNRRADIAYPPK
jgi:peptidoglycan-associated lipoprotein